MGNSGCSCLRSDIVCAKDENKFDIIKDLNLDNCKDETSNHESLTEDVTKKEEAGKDKVKAGLMRVIESKAECPGIEITDANGGVQPNEHIQKTEQRLGRFILEDKITGQNEDLQKFSIIYPDNSFYIGTFNSEWKREGFGTLFLPEGSKYTGWFYDNKMHGKGRIIYSDGDYFQGDFFNNKFEGQGILEKLKEGVIYKGQFKDDLKSGCGEESRVDGSVYKGAFLADYKHGKGRFEWTDRTLYEGDFTSNNIEGFGRIIYSDAKIYWGQWKSNKIDGKGIFYWPDNQCYVGDYIQDKKTGFGIFHFSNGKMFRGYWLNGKQHGCGICLFKGETRLGEWRFGKKIRWLSIDLNQIEDKGIKEIVNDIITKTEECQKFLFKIGISSIEDPDIKERILAIEIITNEN